MDSSVTRIILNDGFKDGADVMASLVITAYFRDTQSDSKGRWKRGATYMELPGGDKRHRVDPLNASQMFMPYNPTGALETYTQQTLPF